MIKKIHIIMLGIMLSISIVPSFSYAAATADGGVGSGDPTTNTFQLVPCKGTAESPCDFNMLIIGANRIIKFLLWLSIPLILGMILYTGFKYVTAGGDPGKLANAKKMFVPVIIGLFWVLGAYLVVYTILDKLVADTVGGVPKKDVIFLDVVSK